MDEHKSKIVHKLVETLCLVMNTPDSKMDKISEDIVPRNTFTNLKKGMDMKESDNIFSKMNFGDEDEPLKMGEDKDEPFKMDKGKDEPFKMDEGKVEPLKMVKDKDEPFKMDKGKDDPFKMDKGKGKGIVPPPPMMSSFSDKGKGKGVVSPPPPPMTPSSPMTPPPPMTSPLSDKNSPSLPIQNVEPKPDNENNDLFGQGGGRRRRRRKTRRKLNNKGRRKTNKKSLKRK